MMKFERTGKERSQIVGIGILLLAVWISMQMLRPLYVSHQEWKRRYIEYELRLEEMAHKSAQLPSVRVFYASCQAELEILQEGYLPMKSCCEIDGMITAYLLEKNIWIKSLYIEMPEHAMDADESIWAAQVELLLYGEQDVLLEILETWHLEQKGIWITGFTWENGDGADRNPVLQVNLEVLMTGKEYTDGETGERITGEEYTDGES